MQEKISFGTMPSGEQIDLYTIATELAEAKILTLGGILQSLTVYGRDVVAGFDTLEDYLMDDSHQGEIVGRTCNRIGNACFSMDGKLFQLAKNDGGKHHLHGGNVGFGRRVWNVLDQTEDSLTLSLYSPDGEENYPGNVYVEVTYRLVGAALMIEYRGKADQKTPLSLTNHAYFNLNGYGNSDILGHTLWLDAAEYTETDGDLIPTGRRVAVKGTNYDFTTPKTIGENMPNGFFGFDDNFVFLQSKPVSFLGYGLHHGATLSVSDLEMQVLTDQPCVQLYIGNFLQGLPNMKGGKPKQIHATACLETQHEPDAVQRGETVLEAGENYFSLTVYAFQKK